MDKAMTVVRAWRHCGYDTEGRYGPLPATLKAKKSPPYGLSWFLVFTDGYEIDTRYAASGRDRFRKADMKYLVEGG